MNVQGASRIEVATCPRLTIGTAADCHLCFPDPKLRPHHAAIEWDGQRLVLVPLEGMSTVNATFYPRGHELRDGDTIQVTKTSTLRVIVEG